METTASATRSFWQKGQLSEGTSTDSLIYRSGFSVQFPFCIQSYDPADPLNLAKHGRATGTNRPTLSTMVTNGVGRNYGIINFYLVDNPKPAGTSSLPRGNFAIRGLNFGSGTADGAGVSWVGNPYNVLFENCTFPGCGLGVGSSNPAANAKNIIIRHCAVSVNGATGGYSTENPTGVDFNYHHNLLMGGADINAANIRGQGISTQNGRKGSGCRYNLFINNPDYAQGVAYIFASGAHTISPAIATIRGIMPTPIGRAWKTAR